MDLSMSFHHLPAGLCGLFAGRPTGTVPRQLSSQNPGFFRPHRTDNRRHFPFTHPIQNLDHHW
jgi:hypothetical protein